YTTEDYW
nr:immunoglobulin heavy chain junction region [Macaca mulatta]